MQNLILFVAILWKRSRSTTSGAAKLSFHRRAWYSEINTNADKLLLFFESAAYQTAAGALQAPEDLARHKNLPPLLQQLVSIATAVVITSKKAETCLRRRILNWETSRLKYSTRRTAETTQEQVALTIAAWQHNYSQKLVTQQLANDSVVTEPSPGQQ